MGLVKIANELKILAINIKTVNQASFGDITLYDNKSTIKYPYVNFDVVSASVNNDSINYTIRIYVCDRNEPYIAYNKTELILNNILKHYNLDVRNYTINYFTLNFKDLVNGCWADFNIEEGVVYNCLVQPESTDNTYVITEDLDYIITETDEYNVIAESDQFIQDE